MADGKTDFEYRSVFVIIWLYWKYIFSQEDMAEKCQTQVKSL